MAMNCEQFLKKYQQFLDRELDDGKQKDYERHLEECTTCERRIRFEIRFRTTIVRKFKDKKAPRDLRQKIRTKLF